MTLNRCVDPHLITLSSSKGSEGLEAMRGIASWGSSGITTVLQYLSPFGVINDTDSIDQLGSVHEGGFASEENDSSVSPRLSFLK